MNLKMDVILVTYLNTCSCASHVCYNGNSSRVLNNKNVIALLESSTEDHGTSKELFILPFDCHAVYALNDEENIFLMFDTLDYSIKKPRKRGLKHS